MKTKSLLLVLLTIASVNLLNAQEARQDEIQTLFRSSGKKISHGFYGALSAGYTNIADNSVLLLGGRAGWLIDHHVTLGLGGYSFTNSIYVDKYFNEGGYYLVGGYGGFFVEPVIAPFFPVHVAFPIFIGGGGVAYNDYQWSEYPWDDYNDYEPYDWDSFFVFEPGVEVELNVIKFIRFAVGASYRFTDNLNLVNSPDDMLNDFNVYGTIKIGKF